jgi:hypothetical protein
MKNDITYEYGGARIYINDEAFTVIEWGDGTYYLDPVEPCDLSEIWDWELTPVETLFGRKRSPETLQ